MKINKVGLENFKGKTREITLSGVDLIQGRNEAGKTAIGQAVSFALTSNVPGLKSQNEAIHSLSSGNTMVASVEIEDETITRSITKNTKINKQDGMIKISYAADCIATGSGVKGLKKNNEYIEENYKLPQIMVDFSSFNSMSDKDKRSFMFDLMGSVKPWSKEKLQEFLEEKMLNPQLKRGNKEQFDENKRQIVELLSDYKDEDAVDIADLIEEVGDNFKVINAEKRDMQAASRQLSSDRTTSQYTDADIVDFKNNIDKLQQQLQDNAVKIESSKNATRNNEKLDRDIEKLEERAADGYDVITNLGYKKAEALGELDKAKSSLANEKQAAEKQATENKDKKEQLTQTLLSRKEGYNLLLIDLEKEESERKSLSENLIDIRVALDEISKEINSKKEILNKISGEPICPLLGTPCKSDFSEIIEKLKTEIEELEIKTSNKIKEQEETNGWFEEQEQLLELLNDLKIALSKDIDRIEKEIDSTGNEIQQLPSENVVYKLQKDLEVIDSRIDDAQKLKSEIESELEDLKNTERQEALDLKFLDQTRESIELRLAETKEKLEQAQSDKQKQIEAQKSRVRSKEIEMQFVTVTMLKNAVGPKGAQGKMIAKAIEPLQDRINEALQLFKPDTEFYLETISEKGDEVFEYGWIDNGQYIKYDALSSGAKAICSIAMLTAFVEVIESPIKLLWLDDIDKLDHDNLNAILDGISKIANRFDNVILSGVVNILEDDRYNIIQL